MYKNWRNQVMKRFFTLATLLVSMVSFAAPLPRAGRIIITNADNSIIQVRINGRSYNVNGQPLLLNNLAGGRHQVQIFKSERRPYGYSRSRPVLIYNAAVYVDPSYIVDLNVNRAGRVIVGKSLILRNGKRFGDDNPARNRYDDSRYENNHDNNNRFDSGNGGSPQGRYNDKQDSQEYEDSAPPVPQRRDRPSRRGA